MINQRGSNPFRVGDRVRYVGRSSTQDGEMNPLLEPGMVGRVIEAYERWVTRDGIIHEWHNRVVFPTGFIKTILPKHFARFERV